tara:strand:+ start:382 stop:627 length:246 start_codon:yes stop_codon:yes gene_type:complete
MKDKAQIKEGDWNFYGKQLKKEGYTVVVPNVLSGLTYSYHEDLQDAVETLQIYYERKDNIQKISESVDKMCSREAWTRSGT